MTVTAGDGMGGDAPRSFQIAANGLQLNVYEWPGREPAVFLAHATGFHGRVWGQIVEGLGGLQTFAIDMRGHGRSEKPEPPYAWKSFGEDVAAVAHALGLKGAIAAGHSKGGHAITVAAALRPEIFGALVLVDPVILPREAYSEPRALPEGEHFAARRRNRWASAEEMYERFVDRAPFSLWDRRVLRDYCDYGLIPAPDGNGFVLACPPRIEASIYGAGIGGVHDIYEDVAAVTAPVRVLRGRPRSTGDSYDMSASPTAPDLAQHFRRGEDVFLPKYGHFLPMEAPALVASHIREMAAIASEREGPTIRR